MKRFLLFLLIALMIAACDQNHFINDSDYRAMVEKRFQERMDFARHRADQLFGVFNKEITTEEAEALKFLYAYMPLCDLFLFHTLLMFLHP